jgi:hydroxyacylglutathione hydrolase
MNADHQALQVHQFICRSDNYGYLVHDPQAGLTACIDTPEVGPIEAALAEKGWQLTHIFNTHHHFDHVGGNAELKQKVEYFEGRPCTVVGSKVDPERIPFIDVTVADGDVYYFGDHEVVAIETPGHTRGHVIYHFVDQGMAFVGDHLFSMGCGRRMESSAEKMWHAMEKIMRLPDETLLYCAHEYTQANARFALAVEPGNLALRQRSAQVDQLRDQGAREGDQSILATHQPRNPATDGEDRRPGSAGICRIEKAQGCSLAR